MPADRGGMHEQSAESDRAGRLAGSPEEIGLVGWRSVLTRVAASVRTDNLLLTAAGISFFGLLALVPSLAAIVYTYGLFADAADVQEQIDRTARVMPQEVRDLLQRQLEGVVSRSGRGLTVSAILAAVLALWSSATALQHTMRATSVAYREDDTRGVVRLRLQSLGAALATVVLVVGGFLLAGLLPAVLDAFELQDGKVRAVLDVLRWPVLGLAMFAGCAVLYRHGPDRVSARWEWVSWGAAIASATWMLGCLFLSMFAGRFDRYSSASGALSAVIVTLAWLFLTSFVVLLGARINAELEQQTALDTTVGDEQPIGQRGAVSADEIATDGPPRREETGRA